LPSSDLEVITCKCNACKEQEEHKEEIVQLTEGVLQAKGIQCDARISKIPEEELREILEKVRGLKKQEAAKQEEGYANKGR
jgi:hypothetical protein